LENQTQPRQKKTVVERRNGKMLSHMTQQ